MKAHGITPMGIKKKVEDILEGAYFEQGKKKVAEAKAPYKVISPQRLVEQISQA